MGKVGASELGSTASLTVPQPDTGWWSHAAGGPRHLDGELWMP